MEIERKTARKPLPERFSGLTCYQLNLRSFTPEGTLEAAEKKLDYIKNAGIDIIYLCPITLEDDNDNESAWSERQKASGLKNPKNPYRVKDYFNVDPEYGDIGSFTEFVQSAHGKGMFVILDLVYTHCGPSCKIVSDYTNFVKKDENGNVLGNTYHFPVLNYDNAAVRSYVIANMKFWLSLGADGFRLDYADGIPSDFWQQAANELKTEFADALIIFEGNDPPEGFADFRYGFSEQYFLYAILNGDFSADKFGQAVCSDRSSKNGTPFLRYIDNHDIITDGMPLNCGDGEKTYPRVKINAHFTDDRIMAAHAIIETLDGLPMIYTGYECGSRAPQSLFSNRFYGDMHVDVNAINTPRGKSHYDWLKTLCSLRKSVPALADGETENVGCGGERGQIVKYDRIIRPENDDPKLARGGSPCVRVFVNVSESEEFLADFGKVKILASRLTSKTENGFVFDPFGVLIAEL